MKGIFIMKKYYKFILSLNEYNEIDSQYEIDDENEGIYSSYEEALEKAKKTKIYTIVLSNIYEADGGEYEYDLFLEFESVGFDEPIYFFSKEEAIEYGEYLLESSAVIETVPQVVVLKVERSDVLNGYAPEGKFKFVLCGDDYWVFQSLEEGKYYDTEEEALLAGEPYCEDYTVERRENVSFELKEIDVIDIKIVEVEK